MGASIKPEIFISYIPQGKINITPQVYISYIPNGKINFNPQIWASVVYVPHVEKSTADTSRNISKQEKFSADTNRKIGIADNARADLKRSVKNIEKAVADTSRKMGVEIANVDTCRAVKNFDSTIADTLREVGITEIISADSVRKIASSEKISADTFLKVTATEKATADTCRRMLERATATTLRKVVRPEKAIADSVIRVPHILNYIAQNSIVNAFKDFTAFQVTLNEGTLSDNYTIETTKKIEIEDAVKGMFLDYPFSFSVEESTEQNLIYNISGMYDIDKLLYSFVRYENVTVPTKTIVIGSNSYGESSSSSSSSYSSGTERLISTADTNYGNYTKAYDYAKKCAEYFGLTPNIKFENFTPSNLDGDSDITYSDLISSLFNWTKQVPQRQINVFIRGGTLHFIQRGLEDSVFDISNIPHSRPVTNQKLIRTLYNSPYETDSVATANVGSNEYPDNPDNPPIYNPDDPDNPDTPENPDNPEEPTYTPVPIEPDYIEDDNSFAFSGLIAYLDDDETVSIEYINGLVTHEYTRIKKEEQTSSQITAYSYDAYGGDPYLSKKSVLNTTEIKNHYTENYRKVIAETNTEYFYVKTYGDIYLLEEKEVSTKKEYAKYKGDWILLNEDETTRNTYHTPLGNLFYATSVYVNGEIQGSSISQGRPGNKVSPYIINNVQQDLAPQAPLLNPNGGDNGESGEDESGGGSSGDDSGDSSSGSSSSGYYIENPNRLIPIDDSINFPVCERELLAILQMAYKWLNRKIQVTVTVDLIDEITNGVPTLNHVVDFTERVRLDGVEYFLVSNAISLTTRKLIQHLQLVRWK